MTVQGCFNDPLAEGGVADVADYRRPTIDVIGYSGSP
jgi:hypothetical protein